MSRWTESLRDWLPPVLYKVLSKVRPSVRPTPRSDQPILHLANEAAARAAFDGHLFICGLHRSGTTMVEHYVRSLFEVAVLRADVPENEGQHLQNVFPPAKAFGGPGRFAFHPEMHLDAPPPLDAAETFRVTLLRSWLPHVEGSERTLSEKSPPNLTKIPWLRAVFPGATFLIVTRDPRAVAGATKKWTHASLEELVFHWHVAHARIPHQMEDDCILVRYEDFCARPNRVLLDSGLVGRLRVRPSALDVPPRFREIHNSNAKYVALHGSIRYGEGAWTAFGYDI